MFGTCAGLILIANRVDGQKKVNHFLPCFIIEFAKDGQALLGGLDVNVSYLAYNSAKQNRISGLPQLLWSPAVKFFFAPERRCCR